MDIFWSKGETEFVKYVPVTQLFFFLRKHKAVEQLKTRSAETMYSLLYKIILLVLL